MTAAPISAPMKRIRTKYRDFSDIPEIDLDMMPVAVEYRGIRALGILSLFLGVTFGILPLIAVAGALAEKEMTAAAAIGVIALCLAVFTPLIIYGLKQLRLRMTVTLDSAAVFWEDRRLGRMRASSEPIRNFAGVRRYVIEHPTAGRYHVLKLEHPNPAKSVPLSTSRDEKNLAERWSRYCRRLRLPAIENLNSEFRFERSPDDLGLTVADLVRAGKLKLPARTTEPPAGAQREIDGLETIFRCADGTQIRAGADGFELKRKQLLGGTSKFKWADIESVDIHKAMRSRRLALVLTHRLPIPGGLVQGDVPRLRAYFGEGLGEPALIWLQYEILERSARRTA